MFEDPSSANVTARIRFKGVMLMCINSRNQCEVGILDCPKHEQPKLIIEPPTGGSTEIDIINNLFIEVVNPQTEGVSRRREGDLRDFCFVPDVEGADLHADKVDVHNDRFRVKLAVTAGLLYTHTMHKERYNLVEWTELNPRGMVLGLFPKIADDPGLNIVCRDEAGSGIAITDTVTQERTWLPRLPDMTYTITILNDCETDDLPDETTDFRLYYDVISPSDERRYDFDIITRAEFRTAPRICEAAFLGITDTLGFPPQP